VGRGGHWGYCNEDLCPSITFPDVDTDPTWKPLAGKEECGSELGFTRIVGGRPTKLGEMPFMVHLTYGRAGFACGASLINRWYVLTAAHCVDDAARRKLGELMEVVVGDWKMSSDPDCLDNGECFAKTQKRKPTSIKSHEKYDGDVTKGFDIAIIKLDRPIDLFDGSPQVSAASPICLPWLESDHGRNLAQDADLTVAGWGKTKFGSSSDILQKVDVPYQEAEVCTDEFREFRTRFNGDLQMCAGGVPGKDSCNGDSGGGLVTSENPDLPWMQVGIVSFGNSDCSAGTPSIYTRVDSFIPWIAKNMV